VFASDGNDGFAIFNGLCCSVAIDPIFACGEVAKQTVLRTRQDILCVEAEYRKVTRKME
jgi:hypothetical protein